MVIPLDCFTYPPGHPLPERASFAPEQLWLMTRSFFQHCLLLANTYRSYLLPFGLQNPFNLTWNLYYYVPESVLFWVRHSYSDFLLVWLCAFPRAEAKVQRDSPQVTQEVRDHVRSWGTQPIYPELLWETAEYISPGSSLGFWLSFVCWLLVWGWVQDWSERHQG